MKVRQLGGYPNWMDDDGGCSSKTQKLNDGRWRTKICVEKGVGVHRGSSSVAERRVVWEILDTGRIETMTRARHLLPLYLRRTP
ncbi:hypothetical protein CCHR01_05265 [Colletotrichum chrysophilum]|uniref:Uncharacterized protein n=1 Tax=Colletotrichum chrysophilum TaxID=1836956 RepID=A0AAD9APA9_9PEZI|nr:hypothetical protein CCHR01_05265 [Colletotrichum chrysophilum]